MKAGSLEPGRIRLCGNVCLIEGHRAVGAKRLEGDWGWGLQRQPQLRAVVALTLPDSSPHPTPHPAQFPACLHILQESTAQIATLNPEWPRSQAREPGMGPRRS